jgi:hypothetical protein
MIQTIKILISKLFSSKENDFPVVTHNEISISCSFPDGQTQIMLWEKLRAVLIETTDEGPWTEDVYFILFSDEEKYYCSIPQCATGSQELLEKLMQLTDFDENAVIKAMGCTSNKSFLCWDKKGWIGENWPEIIAARNYN